MPAFVPALPLRHIAASRPACRTQITPLRRRPRAFDATVNIIRSVVTIRHATREDAETAAKCMAHAFRGEEKYSDPITRWLVTRVSHMDMAAQLARRLSGTSSWESLGRDGRRESVPQAEKKKREHVLLVAEDCEVADGIIGCVEMGVVNVPRLFANGILDEIEQWGQRSDEATVARLDSIASASTHSSKALSDSSLPTVSDDDAVSVASSTSASTEAGPSSVRRKRSNVNLPYIGNLAVDPRARRRGLAKQLMRTAEAEAMEWGYGRVCLHVDASCIPATTLYAALGYDCSAREPEWYPRVGRIRRLFLARDVGPDARLPVGKSLAEWEAADVQTVGTKLSPFEYLRLSFSGFAEKSRR